MPTPTLRTDGLARTLLMVTELLPGDGATDVYWFGLVADGVELARVAPPWSAAPLVRAWGAAGLLLGFVVSAWRGGILLDRWFLLVTAVERARLIAAALAVMVGVALAEVGDEPRDDWAMLPAVDPGARAITRVGASEGTRVWDLGRGISGDLDALGEALEVERWPGVVLLRGRRGAGDPAVRRSTGAAADDPALVLYVEVADETSELAQGVLAAVIGHQLAGTPDWDPDGRWLADGLAAWWEGGCDAARLQRLASLGAGRARDLSRDAHLVYADLGPDVGGAVAWAGLCALEELGGREAVLAAARVPLARLPGPFPEVSWPRSTRLRWVTRPGWVGRATGVDEGRWLEAWERRLGSPPPEVPTLPELVVEAREGEVVATWSGPRPEAAVVEWMRLDPLQSWPRPGDRGELLAPPRSAMELPLASDPTALVVARWVLVVPELGRVTTRWTARP